MGAFIIMACDSRIGTRGDYKMSLPETAIGMELPPILVELTASRISRRHMTRVALLSEVYNPDQAVDYGLRAVEIYSERVEDDDLVDTVEQLGVDWFVEKALFEEYAGFGRGHAHDLAPFDRMRAVFERPYDDQPEAADLQQPPGAEQYDYVTFCGT